MAKVSSEREALTAVLEDVMRTASPAVPPGFEIVVLMARREEVNFATNTDAMALALILSASLQAVMEGTEVKVLAVRHGGRGSC